MTDRKALIEWQAELLRRIERAKLLVDLGLPDPDFDHLAREIRNFNQAALTLAAIQSLETAA